MREFQERRRIKRFLHSRYAIAVLVLLCLFLAKGVWGVYAKYERSKELADRTRQQLADFQAREKFLSQSMESLATDEGKEREIRERFGVAKEGEKLVVLVDDSQAREASSSRQSPSWWDSIVHFFTRD